MACCAKHSYCVIQIEVIVAASASRAGAESNVRGREKFEGSAVETRHSLLFFYVCAGFVCGPESTVDGCGAGAECHVWGSHKYEGQAVETGYFADLVWHCCVRGWCQVGNMISAKMRRILSSVHFYESAVRD